jgi:hypothetical protein
MDPLHQVVTEFKREILILYKGSIEAERNLANIGEIDRGKDISKNLKVTKRYAPETMFYE